MLVFLVVFGFGSCRFLVKATESGHGADDPAQDVAARGKMAEGTDEGIETSRIHDAILPGTPRRC